MESVLESVGVTVAGRTASPEEALALVEQHQPDLLITEFQTPNGGMSGAMLIQVARQRVASLRVVVLGASDDAADIEAAFFAGARAYVLKTAHPVDVAAAIRQLYEHSVFHAEAYTNGTADASHAEPPAEEAEDVGLTRREREILALVSEGYSNRELARMMWVTEQTVKFHLSNIYRKLDVSNRTEASRWAHKHRLVGQPEASTA